jgi:arylsulfatase A-like enzyme
MRDLVERTLIIVVADHGEGLGQHESRHGLTVFDAIIQVPLIIVPPGGVAPEVRISSMVRTVDILPTILDALDLDPPPVIHGRSLCPLMARTGQHDDERAWPVYADTHRYERPFRGGILRGIRTTKWKYTRDLRRGTRGLYDLINDPGETRNVLEERKRVAAELQLLMDTMIYEQSPGGKEAGQQIVTDAWTEERLRALGYSQ